MSSAHRVAKSIARIVLFLSIVFLFSSAVARAENVKDLKPQGYVNDFAGVLSVQAKQQLTALCAEVDQKTKAQIAVVTVSSLEGEPIEQFSIDLATEWGVGPKQQARGVLILIAPNDRKYRIEVGYGLEAILPDGKVGGFGREAVPLLRQNDYSGAALLLTRRIAAVIAQDRGVTLDTTSGLALPEPQVPQEPQENGAVSGIFTWIFNLFIVLILLGPFLGFLFQIFFRTSAGSSRSRRNWRIGGPGYGGGMWGGGGFGGGGGSGGGGFGSFGGGGFGGGGASGGW